MRVLIITHSFPPRIGGSAFRNHNLYSSLIDSGIDASVLTVEYSDGRNGIKSVGKKVYGVHSFLLQLENRFILPFKFSLFAEFLIEALRLAKSNDALIVTTPTGEACLAGFITSKLYSLPLIVDVQDDWEPAYTRRLIGEWLRKRLFFSLVDKLLGFVLRPLFIHVYGYIYSNASAVVAVTEELKKRLVSRGVPSRRVFVLPNVADTRIFKPISLQEKQDIRRRYGIPVEAKVLVYAGSLSRSSYRVKEIVEIAPTIKQRLPEFYLLIIPIHNANSISALIRKLHAEQYIRAIGPLPREEAARLIAASDLGIVPYADEPLWGYAIASKVYDYMACGIPVVGTGPSGALKRFLETNQVGFFITPRGAEITESIIRYLSDSRLLSVLSNNALSLMQNSYNQRNWSSVLLSVLRFAEKITSLRMK